MKFIRVLSTIMLAIVVSFGVAETASAQASHGTVEKTVRAYYAHVPVLIKIAQCESHFQQFDSNGRPFYNQKGSSAVGVMQIISSIHKNPAHKMGYNIMTTEGNLGYALALYKQAGTSPWNASASCWRG
jgi:hypothetical protein